MNSWYDVVVTFERTDVRTTLHLYCASPWEALEEALSYPHVVAAELYPETMQEMLNGDRVDARIMRNLARLRAAEGDDEEFTRLMDESDVLERHPRPGLIEHDDPPAHAWSSYGPDSHWADRTNPHGYPPAKELP